MIDWSARHDPHTEAPPEFIAAYRADPEAFAAARMAGLRALCVPPVSPPHPG